MLLQKVLMMLGTTSLAVSALPTVEDQAADTNSSITDPRPGGFEVVITYVRPEGGCPAAKQCADGSNALPGAVAPSPTASSPPQTPTGVDQPAFSHDGPVSKLLPNVHWAFDTAPATNVIPLSPGDGSLLYYGHSDPTQSGYFGFVKYYFTSPSVNLDHCDHVSGVTCTASGCQVSFATDEAYQYAVQHWTVSDGLILVAFTEGCSQYAQGERCYLKATAIDFKDGQVVEVEGSFALPDDIISQGETEWGWYTPRQGGSGGTTATTTSVPIQSSPVLGGGGSSGNGGVTNSTSFADPRSACIPPVDTIHGLPTACLGDLFDEDLDDNLGYMGSLGASYSDFINSLAPGIEPADNADPNAAPDFGNTLDGPVKQRDAVALSRRRGGYDKKIRRGWWDSLKAKVQQATTISGSIDKDLSFKLPDPSNPKSTSLLDVSARQVKSPWGEAILLKAFGTPPKKRGEDGLSGYMNVYCVGCGVSGHARVAGRASWTPFGGFQSGQLEMHADAQFIFKLGIDAQLTYSKEFSSDLLRISLPGIDYGAVTIGPWAEMGSTVKLDAAAKGRLLAGVEMGLQNSHVLIDLLDSSRSTRDGWEPYFKPVFEADGEIALSATMGLPFGLKCGVRVASFSKTVGIIDEPSIKGTAQAAGSARGLSGGFKTLNGCTGISAQLSWRNRLYATILDQKRDLLDTGDRSLVEKCIPLPALPSSSSTQSRQSTMSSSTSTSTRTSNLALTSTGAPSLLSSTSRTRASSPTSTASNMVVGRSDSHHPRDVTDSENGAVNDISGEIAPDDTALSYDVTSLPEVPYNDTSGSEYNLLTVPDGSISFISCGNGDIYAVSSGGTDNPACTPNWETRNDVLVGDGAHRIMHYYSNTMNAVGVSRLRVSDEESVPKAGVIVAMTTDGRTASDSTQYAAVDPDNKTFTPIVCAYSDGRAPRMFVAADADQGVNTLQNADVEYSITGGKVDSCFVVPLVLDKWNDNSNYTAYDNNTTSDALAFE